MESIEAAELIFICQDCGLVTKGKVAQSGCANGCKTSIFRVARKEFPLIENPQKDPYRTRDTQEDGYDFWTQYGEGTIGGSAGGPNERQDRIALEDEIRSTPDDTTATNARLPTDQDAFDPNANPEPDMGQYGTPVVSPALTDEDSPLNPMNYKEPKHIGPHNMPHRAYNSSRTDSIYDRVRQKGKERK